jgi:hypothetical protein
MLVGAVKIVKREGRLALRTGSNNKRAYASIDQPPTAIGEPSR